MGYEYDFVFDWMVKKQHTENPSATLKNADGEEAKKEDPNAEGGFTNWATTSNYLFKALGLYAS